MDSDSNDCHNRTAMRTYCRISTPMTAWVCFFMPIFQNAALPFPASTGGEAQ